MYGKVWRQAAGGAEAHKSQVEVESGFGEEDGVGA